MDKEQQLVLVNSILNSEHCDSLPALVNYLNSLLYNNVQSSNEIIFDLVDYDFLREVKLLIRQKDILLLFGKSLRNLKCVIPDDTGLREIEIFIRYKGPKKLVIYDANLPHSKLLDKEYKSLQDIVNCFDKYIDSLTHYFYELERIDRFCTVVDPVRPSFRENYRRVVLDDRVWLHVTVSPSGSATNIQLLGRSEHLQDRLQEAILNWDHDVDIVENITNVFDLWHFQEGQKPESLAVAKEEENKEGKEAEKEERKINVITCSICLCSQIPDMESVPQPLCSNPKCTAYFHRDCLFQWLVACSGGRPPMFGVADGSCPACFQSITCNEKDP